MKARLKALAPERARLLVRHLGRLRWITKWRRLRAASPHGWTGRPLRELRYVLTDPEVDSFTYELANLDELADALAATLSVPRATIAGYLDEALDDPDLPADIGWRALFLKRDARPVGHHLAAYAAVRATRPAVAIETGILDGLGSRTILRALQRNGDGHLWSFDVMPGAGALVPPRLRAAWTPVYASTATALEPLLAQRDVGFFLHDSDADHQELELRAVLRRAAPGAVLMTPWGWTGVLQRLTERAATFQERPRDHFYAGRHVAFARLT